MQSSISSQKTPKYKKLSRKRKTAQNLSILSCFMMECRWWDSNPHGFPNDFEFLSSSSIWCHPVISSDIWFPLCKGKIHASTNNNLKYPRFFDAFFLYSVFSVWTAQMENPPQNSKSLVLITRVGSTPTTGIEKQLSKILGCFFYPPHPAHFHTFVSSGKILTMALAEDTLLEKSRCV